MIPEFYKDCEIFITGGSGVVGKSTIDKLLRSCNVKKIYILLRGKKDLSVEQRLEKLKKSKIFRVLLANKPDELNKLVAIPGDAALPKLGITDHYAKVMENVSIVFHCAATVRFNEDFRVAVKLNVGGTWEALKFAESLRKLKIFMHCSTFYSNPYLKRVTAKLYSSPMDWKLCLDLAEDDSKQDLLDTLTKKLIVGFSNTYCFTKNLAESVVNSFLDRLPVAIYRPSIVLFALKEPEPGFPSALVGPMGLFTLVGAGILKIVYIKQNIALDITPLDLSATLMIINAFLAAKQYESGKVLDVPISMFSSYGTSPHTFEQMNSTTQDTKLWEEFMFEKNFLIPHVYFTSNEYIYKFMNFTYQILPSMLGDGLLMLFGRKPVLLSIVRRCFTTLEIMQPFLFNNYESDGVTHLEQIYELTRGTDFSIEEAIEDAISNEGLYESCTNMVIKIREVLLNEDASSIERSKKVLMVKKILYNILYSSPMDWKLCLDLAEDDSKQDLLDTLTKKLIVGFSNTYCFTKNLAESVVNSFLDRLPVAIYRPSIVLFALKEPEPGFPSALVGPMGLFTLVGAGILKIVYIKQNIALDITPLDLSATLMIINAFLAAKQYESGKVLDVPISMFSSYGTSPHTFEQMNSTTQDTKLWEEFMFEKNFLIPHVYFTSNEYIYKFMNFTYQILPSMLGDGLLMLFGRKPVLLSIVRRCFTTLEIMQPFLFNNYESDGVTHLEQIYELTRGTDFSIEEAIEDAISNEGLYESCTNMVIKIREVLLNEDASSIERSKKVLMVKKILYNIVRIILAYYLLRWFYRIISNYLDLY